MKKKKQRHIEPWFSVKCIFQHAATESGPRQMYEERIILVKSNNFKNALKKAEKEAKRYAKDLDGCKFTDFLDAFYLFDDKIGDLTEIYSCMMRSNLTPEKYLEKYYPNPDLDDCQKHGLKHRWFNKDGKNSACYHCKVVKKGQLWK